MNCSNLGSKRFLQTRGQMPRELAEIARNLLNGRDGQILTADLSHPKRVLYQAEPRPDGRNPLRRVRSGWGFTGGFYHPRGDFAVRKPDATAFSCALPSWMTAWEPSSEEPPPVSRTESFSLPDQCG